MIDNTMRGSRTKLHDEPSRSRKTEIVVLCLFSESSHNDHLVTANSAESEICLILMRAPFASTGQSMNNNACKQFLCDAYLTNSFVIFT